MSEEKKELTTEEAKALVDETISKIFVIIENSTAHIADTQRFLVLARIVSFIFHAYFSPIVKITRNNIVIGES